jgi:hypothetical protein
LTTGLLEIPGGAGVTAALAAVARPSARAVPIRKVRIILYLLLVERDPNDLPDRPEIGGDRIIRLVKRR